MNMFFRLTALAGLLAIAGQTFAVDDITRADQIPVLKEEPQHATVSERVTSRFTRSHYRQFDLDNAFSAKIFDRYLNLLDYSHNVLLASDVAKFAAKKDQIGDELRSGKLDVFYDLYNLGQQRRFERYQYALKVLERPMDFTGNDNFNLDRSKAPWPKDEAELNKLLCSIFEEQSDKDEMYASELKGVLLRLRPDFNEKAYGCATFGKLLSNLAAKFGSLRIKNDNFNMMVSLNAPEQEAMPQLTRDNWREAFAAQLKAYKDGGFDRVNPSILKADILTTYPNFNERSIGFKRFSDIMKQLEKEGMLVVEMDEQKTMLIKLL